MTYEDWQSATHPGPMLEFMPGSGIDSNRKLRLFACTCCRTSWHLLADERSRQAVEFVERSVDNPANEDEWEAVRTAASSAWKAAITPACRDAHAPRTPTCAASRAAFLSLLPSSIEAATGSSYQAANALRREPGADFMADGEKAWAAQADLLRCIFGNPFCPVTIDASLLTDSVRRTATAIYEERSFDGMVVLADALEECGVADAALLGHLRSDGPHARGCHVVDLILGKG